MITRPGESGSTNAIYEYYDDGQIASETYLSDSKLQRKVAYDYDDAGYLTTKSTYDGDGKQHYRYVYTCDEDGRIVVSEYQNDELVTDYINEYEYNDEGCVTQFRRYSRTDGEMAIGHSCVYKYDANGNPTECLCYVGDSDELRWIYRWDYDSDGNLLCFVEYDEDRNIVCKIDYTYLDVQVPADSSVATMTPIERLETLCEGNNLDIYIQSVNYY